MCHSGTLLFFAVSVFMGFVDNLVTGSRQRNLKRVFLFTKGVFYEKVGVFGGGFVWGGLGAKCCSE